MINILIKGTLFFQNYKKDLFHGDIVFIKK